MRYLEIDKYEGDPFTFLEDAVFLDRSNGNYYYWYGGGERYLIPTILALWVKRNIENHTGTRPDNDYSSHPEDELKRRIHEELNGNCHDTDVPVQLCGCRWCQRRHHGQ